MATIIFIVRKYIPDFYNLDDETKTNLMNILLVMAVIMIARAMNIVFMMGILKAGGDTFFAMIVDCGGIWIIGVPIAAFTAFILDFPVHYVMAFAAIEEFVKMILCNYRYLTNRWLKNLTVIKLSKE